jgi:hypothetical protein
MPNNKHNLIIFAEEGIRDGNTQAAVSAADTAGWNLRTVRHDARLTYENLTGNIGALLVISGSPLKKPRSLFGPPKSEMPPYSTADLLTMATARVTRDDGRPLPIGLVTGRTEPLPPTIRAEVIPTADHQTEPRSLSIAIQGWLETLIESPQIGP